MLEQSGIASRLGIEYTTMRVNGVDNICLLPKDYNNYLKSKQIEEMKVGDTGGVLEYLQQMQFEDHNFSYALQVDIKSLITNIF